MGWSWFGPPPDDDDSSPGNTKLGGNIQVRGNHIHITNYSNRGGGKGERGVRLSADVYADGSAGNVHATDQTTGKHTSDPNDYRAGGCLAILVMFGGGLVAIGVVIARLLV